MAYAGFRYHHCGLVDQAHGRANGGLVITTQDFTKGKYNSGSARELILVTSDDAPPRQSPPPPPPPRPGATEASPTRGPTNQLVVPGDQILRGLCSQALRVSGYLFTAVLAALEVLSFIAVFVGMIGLMLACVAGVFCVVVWGLFGTTYFVEHIAKIDFLPLLRFVLRVYAASVVALALYFIAAHILETLSGGDEQPAPVNGFTPFVQDAIGNFIEHSPYGDAALADRREIQRALMGQAGVDEPCFPD